MFGRLMRLIGAAPSAAPSSVDESAPSPGAGGDSGKRSILSLGNVPFFGLGLEHKAPAPGATPGNFIEVLASDGPRKFDTVDLVAKPTETTPTSAVFRFDEMAGRRLEPGQEILMEVPEHLRGRPVFQAILEHRQVQSAKSSTPSDGPKPWDSTPGVTALHFHSEAEGKTGGWRYWHAPWGASGAQGGKYAEIRDDWESESHFDFDKNGTVHVDKGWLRHGQLTINALRLRGVGEDPTFVRQVVVAFAPPAPDQTSEHVFSPGTILGDLLTAKGQKFGKDFDKGTFPGALELFPGSDGGEGKSNLPEGASIRDGQLHVPLQPGLVFSGVEIACGDTKPDGEKNTDGDVGTQGHSKLRMGILRAGATEPEWFVEDHGVPPQGVLFGAPKNEWVAQPGDELVFDASVDPTYVMAYRLNYNQPASA